MTDTQTMNRKRRIPRWIKATLACFVVLLAVLAAYLWEAYRFYNTKPFQIVDAYAALNARNDGYSEDQKAWSVYLDVRYNHWWHAANEINAKMFEVHQAERAKEEADIYYDAQDPFTSTHNMFGIPPEHELYADLVQLVDDFGPQFDRIREATTRPVFGTPITDNINETNAFTPDWYAEPPTPDPLRRETIMGLNLSEIGASKSVAGMLDLEAQIAADRGDLNLATENVRAMLRLARQVAGERGEISYLVAVAIQRIAAERVFYLVSQQPSFNQSSELLALRSDFIEAITDPIAWRVEDIRLEHLDMIGHHFTEDGTITLRGLANRDGPIINSETDRVAMSLLWPARWMVMDRAESIEHLETALAALETYRDSGPSGIAAFRAALEPLDAAEQSGKQPVVRVGIMAPAWEKLIYTQYVVQTYLASAAALLAIEQHRLDTGAYPPSLAALAPAYLSEVPHDPFDPGQPLKYRLIEGVPHLYSVGADGDDDRARRPAPSDLGRERDFDLRFSDPNGPSPNAPDADWVIFPPPP